VGKKTQLHRVGIPIKGGKGSDPQNLGETGKQGEI
jgi:hypothetical protein